jgi:hypothetical protein
MTLLSDYSSLITTLNLLIQFINYTDFQVTLTYLNVYLAGLEAMVYYFFFSLTFTFLNMFQALMGRFQLESKLKFPIVCRL